MDWIIHDPLTRFMAQIVAIIVAARVLGLIAKRVGQPVVIAEIAAGIMLGPSVLGWLAPDVAGKLFPVESLGVLRLVSQIGLLLFMFLIGLELDLRLLRGRARSSLVISQTSIVVPFVLGVGLAVWLYEELAPEGVQLMAFALFMGAAMSITAFPVLARILTERRLLRTRVGAVTITCAAIDDVTAWCVLAFAASVARASGMGGAIQTTLMALGYVGVMLFVLRPVLAALAARVATPRAMSQNMVALVLLLVILSAWVTERIGIHVLFGSFLVGVILPKEGGFARAMVEKLEDFVVIVLLPLFFAISGLRTEIGLLASGEQVVVCAVIIAVASLGKFGGATIAARLTGLTWRESGAIGILMNTRGLMELIVLNIGLDLGVISPTLFSMMVIMALVTTVITTPLLQWIYPPSVMARDLVEVVAPPAARPAYRVMACIAHGHAGPGLVTIAKDLAGGSGEVIALHLASSERATPLVGDAAEDAASNLEPALARARELGVAVRPLSFVSTEPAEDIARVADVRAVDVTLLGLHKPVLSRTLLGGVVHDVLHRVDGTVAVYVERRPAPIERVLVPFQGSPHDRAALGIAARLQQATRCAITVLHVIRQPNQAGDGRRAADVFQESGGEVTIETVEHQSPAGAAIQRASDYDLVVVGMGEEWGLGERRLGFGLHPERLIRDCPRSLLIVRGGDDAAAGD